MIEIAPSRRRGYLRACRALALVSAFTALIYLKWLYFDARPDNYLLFGMLIGAETFNIIQAMGFWYTISMQRWVDTDAAPFSTTDETVDIFVTVYGEPVEIVKPTVAAAMRIRHPRKRVWVLDDGRSAEIKRMADKLGSGYLTRPDNRGAKAGNVNEALKCTDGDFVVIFDADHVAVPEFLERTLGGFTDPGVAFVQTPQVYANRDTNRVAAGANDQQGLFYGPIMRGKNAVGAVFSCGTNVIFRRKALDSIGGLPEDSITEDLRVSLLLLKRGYRSVYQPLVLARGIGPVDVGTFFDQQFRWARGGLEIMLHRHPFFRGMGLGARVQYALGFLYWFTGWAYVAYLILPVAYLLFGLRPVQVPNQYPIYFLPYITATLVTLGYASDFKLSFSGLWFTLGSFPVYVKALFSALGGKTARFVVTSKSGSRASLKPVRVHIVVVAVLAFSSIYGIVRDGFTPSVMNNVAFAVGHILLVQGFIRYALHAEVPNTVADDVFVIERKRSARPAASKAAEGKGS